MTTTDKLTDADVEHIAKASHTVAGKLARELLAHRSASQAAPAPVAWFWERGGDLELTLLKDGQYGKCLTAQGFTAHPLYRAPAPSDHAISKEWAERMLPLDEGVTPSAGAPAPSDGLREALLREVLDCQEQHYGYGMRLHIAMIPLAARIRAALTPAPAQEGGE